MKLIRSSSENPGVISWRFRGKSAVSAGLLARHVALLHGPLFDRPDWFAGHAVEHVQKSLLGRLRDCFDGLPIDRDVHQHRGAGNVHVPDAVMDQLIMPLPLAGFQIDGDQALAKQPVAGTMAAIKIASRQFHGQVRHARAVRRR